MHLRHISKLQQQKLLCNFDNGKLVTYVTSEGYFFMSLNASFYVSKFV